METRRDAFIRATGGQPERRVITAEIRAMNDDGGKQIVGHGAVFNQEAEIWDGIYEVVRTGAFLSTIQTADVRALKNHDPNYILGRNRAGTLQLSEDEIGLAYRILVDPNVSYANDLHSSLQRGDISQSSYAFIPTSEKWTARDDGSELRELFAVELFDVSPVTYPAFVGADAQARSALAASGINPDGLARLFLKHQRGTTLTSADRAMVRAAIKALEAMNPTTEEGQRSDPDGTPTVSAGALRMRRARLALALKAAI
jgi:uncharacterized protein